MLNEKIAKQEQERSRLLRSWNNERLLSKASNAYEANAMTEAVTDSAFSLVCGNVLFYRDASFHGVYSIGYL